MEIRLEDFSRCCRCCLAIVAVLKPIFGACLNNMLGNLTNLQITQNDEYPQQMCSQCVLKLSSAYTFYTMVLRNHKTLEDILKAAEEKEELTLAKSCKQINTLEEINTLNKEISTSEKENTTMKNVASNQDLNSMQIKTTDMQIIQTRTTRMSESESSEGSSDKEYYHCSQCEQTSKNQEDLQVHLQTHLVGSRNILKGDVDSCAQLCNICGARFRWRTSLHKHLRQHRGGHRCEVCHKVFAEASTLSVHIVSHSNQKPYQCSTCSRSFTQQSSLRKHARTHDARAHIRCDDCGKSFLHKCSLL